MQRWTAAVILALMLPLVSACGNDVQELLPQAKCDDKVWQRDQDSRNAVGLMPDGVEDLDARFRETRTLYDGQCVLVSEGAQVLKARAWFDAGGKHSPGVGSGRQFMAAHEMDGPLKRISTPAGLSGVSGAGSASLAAPCSYERLGKGRVLKNGEIIVTVIAADAPDPDSTEQRQRAADLALPFLESRCEALRRSPAAPRGGEGAVVRAAGHGAYGEP